MARDYKYAGKTSFSPSGGAGSPGWVWFLAGLLVGLFVTALTYLNMRYSANDMRQIDAEPLSRSTSPSSRREEPPKSVTEAAESTKPTNKRPEPQFEFYTILPEREIRVPEYEIHSQQQQPQRSKKAKAPEPASAHTSSRTLGRYILQVGSFRHLGDADRLKAKLVLSGFDVEIQTISMNSGDTWHRVRLGPHDDLGLVHRIRSELQKSGFTPLVLKEKE
uniref:Sporulation related domain-containing protein n=1 Tax=Candidatus Kentrum sp. LFY TaxID=2126342 RepID=A0A450W7Q2_9GAMM|nr:MAG: Sporulation related domain-containing protein [Candidatus Kentron sp. LFY]